MNQWTRPVSEYRGEFCWSYKEGFSREGRREKGIERLSADLKQLRLSKKREKERKEVAGESTALKVQSEPAVVVDTNGDEYEVCETAKEALDRLVKSDPRLASKYRDYVKKLDARLKPYGTSYDNSFMKSTNVFPSVRAYEMAAEEFEKNQDIMCDQGNKTRDRTTTEWETYLMNHGTALGSVPQEEHLDRLEFDLQQEQQEPIENDHPDKMRQKWVDAAHKELSRRYQGNPRHEEAKERSKDIVPLWIKRGLQRQDQTVKIEGRSPEKADFPTTSRYPKLSEDGGSEKRKSDLKRSSVTFEQPRHVDTENGSVSLQQQSSSSIADVNETFSEGIEELEKSSVEKGRIESPESKTSRKQSRTRSKTAEIVDLRSKTITQIVTESNKSSPRSSGTSRERNSWSDSSSADQWSYRSVEIAESDRSDQHQTQENQLRSTRENETTPSPDSDSLDSIIVVPPRKPKDPQQ